MLTVLLFTKPVSGVWSVGGSEAARKLRRNWGGREGVVLFEVLSLSRVPFITFFLSVFRALGT